MAPLIKPVFAAGMSSNRPGNIRLFLLTHFLILLVSTYLAGAPSNISANVSGAQNAAGQENEVRELELGKPIERELAGGETHAYRLTLAAGQYAHVIIEQRRINVAVSAFAPDGKKLVDADMCRIGEAEPLSLIAETAGRYRLEVRAPDQTAPRGRYEIQLKEVRAATEQDRSAVAAERLLAEGVILDAQATADSRSQAIDRYRQSISLWQAAKDAAWEATALYLMANTYLQLGESQKALDTINQALPLAQAAARRSDPELRRAGLYIEANTLNTIGRVHSALRNHQKAIDLYNQALSIRETANDLGGKLATLNDIGEAYYSLGQYQKALDLFNQAVPLAREVGDRRKEANIINNICVMQNYLGEHKKAVDTCKEALAIKRNVNDREGEATALNNLGNAYSQLGEYQQTLDAYLQAHAIHQAMGNQQSEALLLSNIGWLYHTLGEYEKAADYYNQAVDIFRKVGDSYRQGISLNNLSVSYADRKDFRRALDIGLQALALRGEDRAGRAITLNNIAGAYSNLGDKQKALDHYNQALALHRLVGDPRHMATTLSHLGDLHREFGEYQKALDYLNESLQMTRANGNRNGEAAALAYLASLERDRGNLAAARKWIEEALANVEYMRLTVKSYQQRATFMASFRKYHEFNVDLLMRLHRERPSEGFDAAALQASEKGRARALLDMLAEVGVGIRQNVDPSLIERERTLRESISDLANRQTRLLGSKPTEAQVAVAAKALDALITEYEQLQAQIRQTSPHYAALTQPAPLSLKEIQTQVLDDETVLLEYALGEEKSFLWAVTPTSISSFELPKRAEVESAARQVYEHLTARNRSTAGETLEQRRKRLEQADAEYLKSAAALSRMLLGPVAAGLKGKRLVIVGEGMLHYTTFAALPAPYAPAGGVPLPLIAEHEIVSLPSASVLGVLRRETGGRKTVNKTIAVFADPVFAAADPRVGGAGKNPAPAVIANAAASDVKRSAAESGLQDFARLRFSRQEADQVVRLVAQGKQFEALDFAANRATATSPELDNYAIIHFATHGLINNQHPELSGVVLSLVDAQGRPQNGFLRLYDIYNLRLGADLVVLSACQTALGKEIRGEGILGLTRGFMYAGARRVVASLWQVDDRATAALMQRFYAAMLGEGMRPAAALRAAQVAMWRERRWQAPYYWAAFTLQGEWR